MSKTLIIMQGAPGSGKSSVAEALQFHSERYTGDACIICSADYYFIDGKTGKYNFDASKLPEAHEACRKDAFELLREGVGVVIIDNTNIYKKHAAPYISMARHYGYKVQIIRCVGEWKNVHGVPEEKVKQMRAQMEDLTPLLAWTSEEFASVSEWSKKIEL